MRLATSDSLLILPEPEHTVVFMETDQSVLTVIECKTKTVNLMLIDVCDSNWQKCCVYVTVRSKWSHTSETTVF